MHYFHSSFLFPIFNLLDADSVPMVYCGLFPIDADQYENLRDSLGKLSLNDAALSYEPETSGAMGFGFRCGFLGLLHMEIIQERLEREYDLDLIVTAPSVVYKVKNTAKGTEMVVDAPSKMPDESRDQKTLEPYVKMEVLTPSEYNGAIIELGQERRGILKDIKFLTPTRSTIVYELPLAEVITGKIHQLLHKSPYLFIYFQTHQNHVCCTYQLFIYFQRFLRSTKE